MRRVWRKRGVYPVTKEEIMNKAEMLKVFADATKMPQTAAYDVMMAFFDKIELELLKGGEVVLPGLGKLAVKEAAARKGRNPRTGEEIDIPASKKVVFKAGKEFRDKLN